MAGRKKAADTEKKVTVEAQKEQTQPAAQQASAASQEPKKNETKGNEQIIGIEKQILGAAIAYGKWKPVKEILAGYKWNKAEHSIVAGAINHLCIHDQVINVMNVQLAIGRLYPQEKVKVMPYATNPIKVELFIPLAKKLVELNK